MAREIINVGAAPNDGQGDPIRTAFTKTNNNFGELYSRIQTVPPVALTGSVGDVAGIIVANLRAKQKVVEFMKNELEGDKFTKTVYNSLQEGQAINNQANNEVNTKIAGDVQENIKSKTKAILQGVYVESKKFDTATNTVRVVVKTGTKDIQTAKEMRMLMGN